MYLLDTETSVYFELFGLCINEIITSDPIYIAYTAIFALLLDVCVIRVS